MSFVVCCSRAECAWRARRTEGYKVDDENDERNPHFYSQLLQRTKTHARQAGILGKAARTIIDERRAVKRADKGKKVCLAFVRVPVCFSIHGVLVFCLARRGGRAGPRWRARCAVCWINESGGPGVQLPVLAQVEEHRQAQLFCFVGRPQL